MQKIEFHFDFGSPNAYLAHLVIPEIEKRTGAKFEYVPVLLGGVFKATNNRSPAETNAGVKNKSEYGRLEIQRFLNRYGIKNFKFNPHFPDKPLGDQGRNGSVKRRINITTSRQNGSISPINQHIVMATHDVLLGVSHHVPIIE